MGRSHRLQSSSDPHEDWVDGSWTVDCICGVNFDDGEEMVNCDECGVWVHTRCSRYIKGDDLFTCDKCKAKSYSNGRDSHRTNNDSEETEVAQFLVELPTKTVRMESSYNNGPPPPPLRRPFRLWTDIPMEERVHVQGIPGGDRSMFSGLSSIFTPELWKCTGYVPKKFNFQYREFPCWDEKESEQKKDEEENENPVDKGAGVLFSLSKESVMAAPVAALVGMRERDGEVRYDRKVYSQEGKRWEGDDMDAGCSQNGMKKDRGVLRPVSVHSNKRKKEEMGPFKSRSGKKKSRAADRGLDAKKRAGHTPKTVFAPTSDAKQLDFYEDRGEKSFKTDSQSIKTQNSSDIMLKDPLPDISVTVENSVEKPSSNLTTVERSSETLASDPLRHKLLDRAKLREDKGGYQGSAMIKSSPKADNVVVASMLEHIDAKSIPVKEEVDSMADEKLVDVEGSIRSAAKPQNEDMANVSPDFKDNQFRQNFNGDGSQNLVQPNIEVKSESDNDNSRDCLKKDIKDPGISYHLMSELPKTNDAAVSSSQASEHKAQGADRTSEGVNGCHAHKADELSGQHYQIKRNLEGTAGATAVPKGSLESKLGSASAEEVLKSDEPALNSEALTSQRKMIVCVVKSSTVSCSNISKTADTENSDSINKQHVASDCIAGVKKNHATADVVGDEDRQDVSRKAVKEQSKSSVSSSKASHQSRVSHSSVSRRTVSDSRDSIHSPSLKVSSVQNAAATAASGESAGSLQNQCVSQGQSKTSASSLLQKGEKFNQSSSHSSSKGNHAQSIHPSVPSNTSATLSDEELALLLHQELNSSPRVPRVPRVRHTGSLPQLASPTATTMLIKRTSSSGAKDHGLVPRRKGKAHEHDDDVKRTDRLPSSPDQRTHDMKREGKESATMILSNKKNMSPAHTSTANSGPSSSAEANDNNLSSMRCSPRNISDDETGTVRGPVHHTLPGLINEIMSKGRRMTVDELCDAVLPHWHNLRKHNGERYAYSSHSQAVLDCLRNRHEWARLVDRGPKTSSSRKRRKFDAEESEDNEYGKGRNVKDVESKSIESQREEFPKGKRKARKRRRLALQGRGIKDVRRRRKAELLTDDDTGPFSCSSEESMFSEDEIQGGGPVGSEGSGSSDEAETT